MGPTINVLSWNVRGLNCLDKRGKVKWVLRRNSCDVAILQESKMEVVPRSIVVSLWGRRPVEWIQLPSVGRSGGIIILWDPQILELLDSCIRSFSLCCKFKLLEDNFEWGLIGVYGPNDDHLRCALFEELVSFMSSWDILWCLGGDFNVIRFPSERSSGGHLTWAMRGFSAFIDSCNLIDPPLEGARFTWSSPEEVPAFSRIDWVSFLG